jgi:hypothetical protein
MISNQKVIYDLINNNRACDLYLIVTGLSEYNRDAKGDEVMDEEEQKLWHVAMTHLEFLSKFGKDKLKAEEDGKHYYAFPEEFDNWVKQGAPGIFEDELSAYLEANPLV